MYLVTWVALCFFTSVDFFSFGSAEVLFLKKKTLSCYTENLNEMIKNLFESTTGLPVQMEVKENLASVTVGIGLNFKIDISELEKDEVETMVFLKVLFVAMVEWHDSFVPCDHELDSTIEKLSNLVLLKEEVSAKGATMKYVIDKLNEKYVEV